MGKFARTVFAFSNGSDAESGAAQSRCRLQANALAESHPETVIRNRKIRMEDLARRNSELSLGLQ